MQHRLVLNANDKIYVRLTNVGRNHIKSQGITYLVEVHGWIRIPFWQFVGLFGELCQIPTFNPVFEPNIVIKDSEIESYFE